MKSFYFIFFFLGFFYFPYFLSFSSSLLETQTSEAQRLSLLQKSKRLSDLQEGLKKLEEKEEVLRACEFEKEFKKIPKACFQVKEIEGLNQEEKRFYYKLAQSLCRNVIQESKSLEDLKRWKKISSLNLQCKNWLQEKIDLLIYSKDDPLNPVISFH